MKKIFLVTAALFFGFVNYANAIPVEINFDEQPQVGTTGVVITTQYSGVVFSSTAGNVNYISTQSIYNSTKPNFLCSGPVGGSINCTADTVLSFETPVSNLTFDAVGINDSGKVAEIDIYVSGIFASTFDVMGNAELYNPLTLNFSAYANITQIRMKNITDGAGIGWDTFKYDQSQSVPEPSTMLLLGSGLLGLVGLNRRHKA